MGLMVLALLSSNKKRKIYIVKMTKLGETLYDFWPVCKDVASFALRELEFDHDQ